jgi:hypothetical protein
MLKKCYGQKFQGDQQRRVRFFEPSQNDLQDEGALSNNNSMFFEHQSISGAISNQEENGSIEANSYTSNNIHMEETTIDDEREEQSTHSEEKILKRIRKKNVEDCRKQRNRINCNTGATSPIRLSSS